MKKQAILVIFIISMGWGYAVAQMPVVDMTPSTTIPSTTPYTPQSYTPQTYAVPSDSTEEDTTAYNPVIAQFIEETAMPGDIVTLKLSFQLPKGMGFPEKIPIQGLEEYHVMGLEPEESDINIKLMVDTVDTFDVPPLKIFLTHPNGTQMAFKSDPVMLSLDLPFDQSDPEIDIQPIKDIIPVNTAKKYVIIAIVAVILLFVGFGIWWFIKKRHQKIIEEQYQKLPEEIAFDGLRDLNRDAHLFRDNIKAYYFRMTQILKEYMGKIRQFPAAELTTEEIAAYVKENLDIEMVRLMRKADMIKFADFRPTTAERETHWKTIWSYVKTTSDERNQKIEETN
jgi:hypothetical protein